MGVSELTPKVAPCERKVVFRLRTERLDVECAITREALEEHFWLPLQAGQTRMLKAFVDGRQRIIAVAERKIRLHPGQPIRLTAEVFRFRS